MPNPTTAFKKLAARFNKSDHHYNHLVYKSTFLSLIKLENHLSDAVHK